MRAKKVRPRFSEGEEKWSPNTLLLLFCFSIERHFLSGYTPGCGFNLVFTFCIRWLKLWIFPSTQCRIHENGKKPTRSRRKKWNACLFVRLFVFSSCFSLGWRKAKRNHFLCTFHPLTSKLKLNPTNAHYSLLTAMILWVGIELLYNWKLFCICIISELVM